jgi:hypothetical protein
MDEWEGAAAVADLPASAGVSLLLRSASVICAGALLFSISAQAVALLKQAILHS